MATLAVDEMDEQTEDHSTEGDGLANMMAKIIKQNVGSKVPVLAKRKTNLMKQIEEDKMELEKQKKAKREKMKESEKKMVNPNFMSIEYERQLRKLATKGVVALFNAISKAKQESELNENTNKSNKSKESKNKSKSKPKLTTDEVKERIQIPANNIEDNKKWNAVHTIDSSAPFQAQTSKLLKNWDIESEEEEMKPVD